MAPSTGKSQAKFITYFRVAVENKLLPLTLLLFQIPDTLFLALELLGTGEHRLRCLPVQTDYAEQDAPGAGRLRGRESCQAAEDVLAQVGVHLHAGRCNNCSVQLLCLFCSIDLPLPSLLQAESQSKVAKKRDKLERKVLDSQERAFWDVHRPMPGCVNTTEIDIKKAYRRGGSSHGTGSSGASVAKNPVEQLTRIITLRKQKLERRTIKVSKAAEA